MPTGQLINRIIVTDHGAFETPFPAQYIAQQPFAGMAWDAVDFVIRSHHRLNASTLNHLFERWKKIFAQYAFGDGSGADIGSAFWLAVARQVLECCKHFARS